jgi:molybdopterin-binding protein
VNKLDGGGGKSRYLRPHEIEVVFAAEFDPETDVLGKVQHLFSAGPVATLSLKLKDGQFVEVEVSRKSLDEMGLDMGDEVAVRLKGY